MSPSLNWFRARRLAGQVIRDWAQRPDHELRALLGDGGPHIQQCVDAETGAAYMETVTLVLGGDSALLAAVIQPIATSGVGRILSIPATASTRIRLAP